MVFPCGNPKAKGDRTSRPSCPLGTNEEDVILLLLSFFTLRLIVYSSRLLSEVIHTTTYANEPHPFSLKSDK